VGYRVVSKKAARFRQWATSVLKSYTQDYQKYKAQYQNIELEELIFDNRRSKSKRFRQKMVCFFKV